MEIILGSCSVWKGSGTKRRCVVEDDGFMYVPLLQSLQALLRNDAVLTEVH